ncbi:hypothetical protein HNQ39_005791 [Armatimonas rosea]|uniref:Uncharacterized protein n=1 Tax=Armatimonas rosea TaxID=685828 RepID=A0A7W9W8U7_ARMRO|nr:hypothetical protein [Armatimonas rosea]
MEIDESFFGHLLDRNLYCFLENSLLNRVG